LINCQVISLEGKWKSQPDPENVGLSERWFDKVLRETIELPGSCEQQGFGVKTAIPEDHRLTREIKYEGRAWYQKVIEIPSSWEGKRLELFLERCHWESSVWLDGKPYGMKNSLSVPHIYDLGSIAKGHHTLTICIDNTYKLPIGLWGFALSEDTQGNWNGIIGRMEVRATDPVWIRDVQVYPDHLQINLGNITGKSLQTSINKTQIQIPIAGAVMDLPFQTDKPNWDEFSPAVNTLTLVLDAGNYADKRVISYGLRELGTEKGQFVLNGRPTIIRGPVDECIYPLTGYPPMHRFLVSIQGVINFLLTN